MFHAVPYRPSGPRTSPSERAGHTTPDASPTGFALVTSDLKPIYANETALRILNYLIGPDGSEEWEVAAQARIRLILQMTEHLGNSHSAIPFTSGRRRYLCRLFPLDVRADQTQPPLIALVMERLPQSHESMGEMSRRFHLSPRECETVLHLTKGLTNKEIAQRMKVSPNTVKQFIRLTMSKMNVTSRSGILGKAFGKVPDANDGPPERP